MDNIETKTRKAIENAEKVFAEELQHRKEIRQKIEDELAQIEKESAENELRIQEASKAGDMDAFKKCAELREYFTARKSVLKKNGLPPMSERMERRYGDLCELVDPLTLEAHARLKAALQKILSDDKKFTDMRLEMYGLMGRICNEYFAPSPGTGDIIIDVKTRLLRILQFEL